MAQVRVFVDVPGWENGNISFRTAVEKARRLTNCLLVNELAPGGEEVDVVVTQYLVDQGRSIKQTTSAYVVLVHSSIDSESAAAFAEPYGRRVRLAPFNDELAGSISDVIAELKG